MATYSVFVVRRDSYGVQYVSKIGKNSHNLDTAIKSMNKYPKAYVEQIDHLNDRGFHRSTPVAAKGLPQVQKAIQGGQR